MASAEQKIVELNLAVPTVGKPAGSYLHATRTGNLVFTAGQLPVKDGVMIATGKVPEMVSMEHAHQCAQQAVLNALAAIRSCIGSLDNVVRIVRMNVYVNSSHGFIEQAKVANAASDLLVAIFGAEGRHTRCAIGAAELPLNVPVELDLIAEVK